MEPAQLEALLLAAGPLRPCPFDGGQGVLDQKLRGGCKDGEPDAWCYWIRCLGCAATGPWMKTPGNAVRMWNMRPDDANQASR